MYPRQKVFRPRYAARARSGEVEPERSPPARGPEGARDPYAPADDEHAKLAALDGDEHAAQWTRWRDAAAESQVAVTEHSKENGLNLRLTNVDTSEPWEGRYDDASLGASP